jgi:broad specificity phosphatase PhoE
MMTDEEEISDGKHIYIVRHGERLDEAPGNNWRHEHGGRWFDPPITAAGELQVRRDADDQSW